MASESTVGLRGRQAECRQLRRLLDAVRRGDSPTLVLSGEAGIGKSALLDYLVSQAEGCHVVRVAGVQAEAELAFAGLHQLCAPLLDHIDQLPEPQRDALRTAFGLSAGPAPDRFLVGLAVLSLMAAGADGDPLVCVVDDAQWVDQISAETLAFVARRLVAESVALVVAIRDPAGTAFAGLPQLEVKGLPAAEARELLAAAIPGPLDERVRDRILAELHGNPLALLELPRGLTYTELAGGFRLPDDHDLADRIEDTFQRRLTDLPRDTRRLLLIAAVEPTGDPALIYRAALTLGITPGVHQLPGFTGLLEWGRQVTFRHPLARSAIRRAASPADLREAHRSLADATDPVSDPDRRAWHLAHAAEGPDEAVAAELERSAGRARSRGGLAAAAAFLERATRLTPDRAEQVRRAIAAATVLLQTGVPNQTLELLAIAEAGPLDELQRAQLDLLRAEAAFATSHGHEAPPLLLAAAHRLERLDSKLARDTYLDALSATTFAGRLAARGGVTPADVAQAARRMPREHAPAKGDLLLDALATLFTDGYRAAAPAAKEMLRAFCGSDLTAEEGLRWLWLAEAIAADLWDDESWDILSGRHVQFAREAGALSQLILALNTRIAFELFTGHYRSAVAHCGEAAVVAETIASSLVPYGALRLAAWQGRRQHARQLLATVTADAAERGEGIGLTVAQSAAALLANSSGDFERALVEARRASECVLELAAPNWGLVELIEAAAYLGRPGIAADAFAQLSELTSASGTDWALGLQARSRALLGHDDDPEPQYREAIARLRRTKVRAELARATLVYGEWLRRRGRRLDAREQLRTAHEMFVLMGAEGFAERARRELAATGEKTRDHAVAGTGRLTARESQIARLARDGLSNPEIASRLFLSPRTVEYHLGNAFAKLGISSRHELNRVPGDVA
ncbi:LuxR family transcriptional regulator [Kribbella jejuensis]|uniref:LuxR family transcriptional regulator n=1 Tax=Kribbella jejuensis TaxID=236068 RepID=A0A542E8N0_9ACTN|nr:LuxR family transcriptional regulator [Kribbella jejuensis]TQJ11691.1 LuxR family transcriptional regulator [Kribbella jejuensis]